MIIYAEQFNFQYIINEIAFYILLFASRHRYVFLSQEKMRSWKQLLYCIMFYATQFKFDLNCKFCVWGFLFQKVYLLSKELELGGQITRNYSQNVLVGNWNNTLVHCGQVNPQSEIQNYMISWLCPGKLKKKTIQTKKTPAKQNPPTGSNLRNHYFMLADGTEGC